MKAKKLFALLLILSLGCAGNPSYPSREKISGNDLSRSDLREIELGNQIHSTITSSFQIYTEPRLVGYINRIGKNIAKTAERQDLTYRFTVLYDDRIYARGAPGGFVYLTTGSLNFIENEAELAAFIAHEIGELQYRDPQLSTSRQNLDRLTQFVAMTGPFFGQIGVLAASSLVLVNAMAESRTLAFDERVQHADRKALGYLIQAGYDPQGYVHLLDRFLKADAEWLPYLYDYLTSRFVTEERYFWVVDEFEQLPLSGKSFSVNRERYLELTKGVRQIFRQ